MMRAALTTLTVAVLATCTTAGLAATPRAARPSVPVTQPLVILLQDHVARASASTHARVIEPVAALRPLTQVRTVLPVMGAVKGKDGNRWVHVRLPGRPSGHTGWILADQTVRSSTEWRVVVKVSTAGSPSTATASWCGVPGGRAEGLDADALRAVLRRGSPRHLAPRPRRPLRAGHQRTLGHLPGVRGRAGQIAIHGTGGLSDPLGSAASHGCIRISPAAITWMSSRIGGGVPVTVER